MTEQEEETLWTNVCTGKKRGQIQSHFLLFNIIVVMVKGRKVLSTVSLWQTIGSLMCVLTQAEKEITSNACLLLSIVWAHACRQPISMTSLVARKSPLGCPSAEKEKE